MNNHGSINQICVVLKLKPNNEKQIAMKKLTFLALILSFSGAIFAQSLNVSSAIEAQNRGYLRKARGYIDAACQHEQTKGEARAWYYKTLIYCKIGGAIADNTKEGKALKTEAANWPSQAYEAALTWQQLDNDGEYKDKINPFFSYLSAQYYNMAAAAASDQQNYALAMSYCDSSITLANAVKDNKFVTAAQCLAGKCAANMQNMDAVKKYFQPLTRGKNTLDDRDAQYVYNTLFQLYTKEQDTVNAMKLARNYNRNRPNDYHASEMLASAYLLNGNTEKGIETINKGLEKVKDNPAVYGDMLCRAANIYELAGDFSKAEEQYKESLTMNEKQFTANFGMGSMVYNRAVDKVQAAANVPIDDETGLYDQLVEESKGFFQQSIPYFTQAVAYIDGLTNEAEKAAYRANLYNCLTALNNVYARLEMFDEMKAVKARMESMQN